ncbi:MAG TPA: hypothetical protein VMM57_02415 [Bacteroidota bacterium]|nr:hypothetical protein [Bacteroidota bacterium]
MGVDEIKSAIDGLSTDERRKVALYILELEKKHVQDKYGPQIEKDIDDVSRVVQDAFEKLRKVVGRK